MQMVWSLGSSPGIPITSYQLEYKLTFESAWRAVDNTDAIPSRNVTTLYPFANYQVSRLTTPCSSVLKNLLLL